LAAVTQLSWLSAGTSNRSFQNLGLTPDAVARHRVLKKDVKCHLKDKQSTRRGGPA